MHRASRSATLHRGLPCASLPAAPQWCHHLCRTNPPQCSPITSLRMATEGHLHHPGARASWTHRETQITSCEMCPI